MRALQGNTVTDETGRNNKFPRRRIHVNGIELDVVDPVSDLASVSEVDPLVWQREFKPFVLHARAELNERAWMSGSVWINFVRPQLTLRAGQARLDLVGNHVTMEHEFRVTGALLRLARRARGYTSHESEGKPFHTVSDAHRYVFGMKLYDNRLSGWVVRFLG